MEPATTDTATVAAVMGLVRAAVTGPEGAAVTGPGLEEVTGPEGAAVTGTRTVMAPRRPSPGICGRSSPRS